MVVMAKKDRKNKQQLIMKNLIDKTAIVEITKMSNIIDHESKYSWAISNANINEARNL